MLGNRNLSLSNTVLAAFALYAGTAAAEHHGRVLFGRLPVPGATVTVSRAGQQLSTVTDTQGLYQFPDLAAGQWTMRVQMFGFAPVETAITVPTGDAPALDLKMLPLAEVVANAEKASAAPVAIAVRTAEAPPPKAAGATADSAPPAPPTADADRAADGMLINGSENNAATSKYSISPAFGTRRAGSKALYTGSLGAQLSNSAFDARPYSVTGLPVPKASYNRFTGTATLGGPIRIPHLLPFGPNFFVGYQWTRDREADTFPALVPTLAQRTGDLSGTVTAQGTPVTVLNPATGLPYTGAIPVSAQAAALLALYPLPNLAGNTSYNYQTQVLNNTHVDALQSRLDKSIGRRDNFYGGFAFRSVRSDNENLFHFRDVRSTLGIDSNVNWSHRFPHQILMETGYRFSRLRTAVQPYFGGRANISGSAGISGNSQDSRDWGPPNLSFTSIAGLNDVPSAFNRNRTDAVYFTGTWNHRKHVVKVGLDFRRQEFNQLQQQNPRGTFTFTGAATQAASTTGSDFADFLIGVPDTSAIAFGNADKYFRQSAADLYVSDDWRLQPNLTLNTGLRWDYGAPLTELKGRLVNLDVAPGFTSVAQVLGSNPKGTLTGETYPAALVRPDYRKFQPRLSLSWRPLPTSSLVVRAGYGIYVDTSIYLNSAQSMSQQAPLSKSLSVSNSSTCPLTLADGFRNCTGTTANTFAIDPNFRTGYAQVWRLSAQQDLPGALVMTATYLGTKGTRAPQEFLPNTYAPGSTAFCATCPRGFVYRTSNADSIRHAAQVQLRRRLRSGLTASLDYTFAHSIDNASLLGGSGYTSFGSTTDAAQPSESIAQNWLDLRAERSRSSFDQRHLLKLTFQYTTGVGARGGTFLTGWRGTLLKNWTLASQFSAGSGLPQTPIYLSAIPGTGFNNIARPNRTAAPLYTGPAGYFLNAAAYSTPVAGQWGNAGRYSIEGPNAVTLDSSFARTFKFRDPTSFDLRLDATNLLNHVVFTGWNTITNSTTFGLPAGTRAMRSLQISGRLRF